MQSSVVADVIIFCKRDEVLGIIKNHVKMKGVSNIVACTTSEETIDALQRFSKGLLIVDWEVGAERAVRILGANRKIPDGTTRPMLLIASDVSEVLVTTAAEYGVSQIFSDNMEKKLLTAKLTNLMMQENLTNEFKKTMQQVVRFRHKGKDDKALEILEKQYKKTPNDLRITAEYGDCLMATGDWEKARKILNPMTETKPPYLRGIHLFGRCLFHQGKFEEAHKVLEQVQLFNPNDADRLVDLGNVLLQMDKVKDAIEHFDRAIEIDDTLTEAKVGKGQGLLMEGQVNDALAILKEVSNKREMASIFNLAAVMSMRQKRFDPGMKLYMAAIKVLGQDKIIHSRLMFNMGIGYRRWSKPDKALTCFDESLKLDPSYKKADAQKAMIHGKDTQEGEIEPPGADEIVTIMEMNSSTKPKEDSSSLDFDVDFGQLGGDDEEEDGDDDLEGMEEGITVDDD